MSVVCSQLLSEVIETLFLTLSQTKKQSKECSRIMSSLTDEPNKVYFFVFSLIDIGCDWKKILCMSQALGCQWNNCMFRVNMNKAIFSMRKYELNKNIYNLKL